MSRIGPGGAPVIGVTADLTPAPAQKGAGEEALLFLPRRYCLALQRYGALPVMLAPVSQGRAVDGLLDRLDGLLISGGNFDIHPRRYGEKAVAALGEIKPERTAFELELIERALRRDMPLLGICGGAQALNVALGGSLYQDISTQLPGAGVHQRTPGRTAPRHSVRILAGTLLRRIVGSERLTVNSRHHQAVKEPGKGLVVNATAGDGLIEGIESRNHPFALGVQWHPEALSDRSSAGRRILTFFVATCRRFARRS
ncbi:MAG TPA: gamma-glutamyl-gamma-aminobutyrate hydrolase family protein [candidate division Zixibacteria bacterium]|nr:gamma-glutamyl-gamma-aminobutyrate hydrolase family protein [candidate division Zixibacteria bacterium]